MKKLSDLYNFLSNEERTLLFTILAGRRLTRFSISLMGCWRYYGSYSPELKGARGDHRSQLHIITKIFNPFLIIQLIDI